jgi:hypothetical protein
MAPLRTLSGLAARFCTPYEVSDAVVLVRDWCKIMPHQQLKRAAAPAAPRQAGGNCAFAAPV